MVQILIAFVIGAGLGFGIGRVIPRRVPAIAEVSPAPPPVTPPIEPGPEGSSPPDSEVAAAKSELAEGEPAPLLVVTEGAPEPEPDSEGIDQRMGGVLAELERRYEGRRAELEEAARPPSRRPRRKPAK